ncbi:GNAT family N-acetyltransferase [Cytobacillus dafuensis]|uniref:GNAT family N-acetyltransferase n=1 Tax=Cytobacillus dafuensis TaxID=1742359 RepID=A0A5B8Z2B0_CYTDA|nr:GNAT family N-acetyltransferase [Cytobacillus dafuensis]QED47180.1 GNAT family N-acetyltransferase [Cytobacillus dafuensis]
MEIRKACSSDWSELWYLLFSMGKTDSEHNTKQRFLNMLDNPQHYIPVAIIEKRIVGYGWLQDYGFHLRMGKKTSRMNDLFVLPEYRKIGIASNIFKAIQEWAIENETSWLQWNSSPNAVQFYQKLGLSPLIEEDDYPFFEIEF